MPAIQENITFSKSHAAQSFNEAIKPILEFDKKESDKTNLFQKGNHKMRIAIPVSEGKLSLHFGHCDQFAIFEIDNGKIIGRNDEVPPAHEPGVLPKWLHEIGVNVIIAGGMGQRAQQLFAQNEIEVVIGAQAGSPEELVSAYLQNTLATGENICDH